MNIWILGLAFLSGMCWRVWFWLLAGPPVTIIGAFYCPLYLFCTNDWKDGVRWWHIVIKYPTYVFNQFIRNITRWWAVRPQDIDDVFGM